MDKNEMKHNGPRRGGPGPGPGGGEKAKDFVGTWKKLLGYIRRYLAAIVVALICAVAGTVLTLAGPDKLSDMTNTITGGVKPDTEKLQTIAQVMSENIQDNMETLAENMTAGVSDSEALRETLMQAVMSGDIALDFQALQENDMSAILALPDSVLAMLFPDIEMNGSLISWEDQVAALELLASMEGEETPDLQALPKSVLDALYSDIVIDGVTITAAEQREMVGIFSELDLENVENTEDALAAMDRLPESVYGLIEPGIDMDAVFEIGMTLVCFYVLSLLLSSAQSWIMATITQRVSRGMRGDISRKINRLPIWFYNRTTTGDVLSRVTNDVDTISQSLNQSIGTLVSAVVLFIGSLIMMIRTNGTMTITAVVASLLGFVLTFAIMGRSQKYFSRQQKHLGAINGYIEEIYSGQTVVKAYNGESNSKAKFDEMNDQLRDAGFKAQCMGGLMHPLMGFVGNFGYVAVCVVGGALAMEGKIEFGVIVAFMMYVRYFTNPLSQMAQAMQSLQSAAAAGERVFEFLEAEEMEDESSKARMMGKAEGYVEFEHVKFGYEDSDRTVIHDFSASAKPGQKIAIVGPTGAGKTTLVNLLMRFHEIQEGEIRIDGLSTKKMPREDVRSQFCMVLQDTWLFEGTVRENLVYCTRGVTEEQMRGACKAVGLDHFIRTLPQGYDTVLNDQVSLSQGQKQQLTIARAMIADRPMLILDEATSSVDTRTELQIQEAMDKLMENRTSFVIAHRLSTIKNADLILVIREGDIVESGTHEELLAKGGFYAELYNSQFEEVG